MLSWLCPPFRVLLTEKDTDTAEDMVPTTARTMEAVADCGDRVPGRLLQAPATYLLVIQAGSVSRATPPRRCRPRSYQVPQVREVRQWSVAMMTMACPEIGPAAARRSLTP